MATLPDMKTTKKRARGHLGSGALLGAVAHELINMPVKPEDSLHTLRQRFYSIMRKHGVKQGTETENGGRLCNNPDWQGAEDIFAARLHSELTMMALMHDVPKDLLA